MTAQGRVIIFSLSEFLKATNNLNGELRPTVICNDGFSMSIQASKKHYCSPKADNEKEYKSIEIGIPSEEVPELEKYRFDKYGFANVPFEVAEKIIKKHKGINFKKTM